MLINNTTAISQAEIEQATGLTREVLRKWELRYQFPVPSRCDRGRRVYTMADVQRLQLIKRLLNQGLRPGKLMHLSMAALQALLDNTCRQQAPSALNDTAATALLACLQPGAAPQALGKHLDLLLNSDGLAYFIDQYLPAFNQAVGTAWMQGRLGVYAEHFYTETVRHAVANRIASLPHSYQQPRVLMTTPPGELHCLGLLALHAALALQGADCVNLGTQTPAADVLQAVHDLGVRVLAISVSIAFKPTVLQHYISDLRQQLPPDCALWVGGAGSTSLVGDASTGLMLFEGTGQAAQAWGKLNFSN
jgi:DNA-binding transcriptional MerR regulator/methanogenic corrinoid protein MtbC1